MTALDAKEILLRARAIVPTLAANAAEGRVNYRTSAKAIAAMRESGVFRTLQPLQWGGCELDPRIVYEAEMTLAEGDISAAWILGFSGPIAWLLALFDARAAEDVWGKNQDAIFCCSLPRAGVAEPVAGGFRLSGRWSYASGCDHSDWAVVGVLRGGGKPGPEDHLMMLVPRADFEIVETWRAPGMQATGSHDIVVRDAFVPAHRIIRMLDNLHCTRPGLAVHTAPIYRMPFGQIFGAGVSVAAAGALQALLDEFIASTRERKRMGASLGEDPDAQLACAQAWGAIDLAHMIIDRNFGALLADGQAGVATPIATRLRYKYQMSTITERCRAAAQTLVELSGAAGLSGTSPLPRLLADIAAGRQHISNQHALHGRDVGRGMLGLPEKLEFMV